MQFTKPPNFFDEHIDPLIERGMVTMAMGFLDDWQMRLVWAG
jgi:hypothetical protein